MFPLLMLTILLGAGLVGIPGRALGQDQFYQGKVLRIRLCPGRWVRYLYSIGRAASGQTHPRQSERRRGEYGRRQ